MELFQDGWCMFDPTPVDCEEGTCSEWEPGAGWACEVWCWWGCAALADAWWGAPAVVEPPMKTPLFIYYYNLI